MQSESERKELHDAQDVISAVRNRRESLHDRLSRRNSFEEASGGELLFTRDALRTVLITVCVCQTSLT